MTEENNNSSTTKNQYFDLIKRAATLQREYLGDNRTSDFIKDSEGEVFYTFDTDVFVCYANSLLTGPLIGLNKNGYGQLLPRKFNSQFSVNTQVEADTQEVKKTRLIEDRNAVSLARHLAEEALKHHCEDKSLLQLKGHFTETANILNTIDHKRTSLNESDFESRNQHRKNIINHALDALLTRLEEKKVKISPERFLDIFVSEIMRREKQSAIGIIYEAMEYKKLGIWEVNSTRRKCLSNYIEDNQEKFSHFNEHDHKEARSILLLMWGDLLRKSKTYRDRRNHDIDALTELAIINQHLFKSAEWGAKPIRVIFVTGDINILEACYRAPEFLASRLQYYTQKTFGELSQAEIYSKLIKLEQYFGFDRLNTNRAWFDRFSFHYIRHIRAYSRIILEENTEQAGDKAGDIFDGLFAAESKQLMRSRRALERLIRYPNEKGMPEELHNEFIIALEKWNHLIKRAIGKAGWNTWVSPDWKSCDIRKKTTKIIKGTCSRDAVKKVSSLLCEYVDRVQDSAMISLSDMGAGTLKSIADLKVTYPPDLYFSSLTHSQNVFTNLATNPEYLKSDELAQDYAGIRNDCYPQNQQAEGGESSASETLDEENSNKDERWEHHLRFLVLGAFFASAQKWSAAQEHARRAVAIIERANKINDIDKIKTKDKNSNPSGREAYFLSSVCQRIRAEDFEQICKAENFLKKAEEAFKKDLEIEKNHPLKETRFKNEKLSIALAKYYQTRLDLESIQQESDGNRSIIHKRTIGNIALSIKNAWREIQKDDDFKEAFLENKKLPGKLTSMYIALNILQLLTIVNFWETFKKESDSDSICNLWKKEISKIKIDKNLIKKALACLEEVNKDTTPLCSIKMAKAYQISATLILERKHSTGYEIAKNVGDLFVDILRETRANYDYWRVKQLKNFIIYEMNRLDANDS